MATVKDVISAKLERFEVEISEIELDALIIDAGVTDGSAEYSAATSKDAKAIMVKIIPELLASPDVSEGGYSRKWDREGLNTYYRHLCRELGISDRTIPEIKDISDRW